MTVGCCTIWAKTSITKLFTLGLNVKATLGSNMSASFSAVSTLAISLGLNVNMNYDILYSVGYQKCFSNENITNAVEDNLAKMTIQKADTEIRAAAVQTTAVLKYVKKAKSMQNLKMDAVFLGSRLQKEYATHNELCNDSLHFCTETSEKCVSYSSLTAETETLTAAVRELKGQIETLVAKTIEKQAVAGNVVAKVVAVAGNGKIQ